MNGNPTGSTVPQSQHGTHREIQRPTEISQALLQGTLEISAIFERRVAGLKANYENTIRALAQERDALLASSSSNVGSEVDGTLVEELEGLRRESESWRRDRAQWERALTEYTTERANWAQEREVLLQHRMRLEQECEELRGAREQWQNERTALEQQCERIQHEDDIQLQEKDATIQELEARVRWLESTQASSPAQPPTVLDQTQFDTLDIFQSPPRVEAYPTMSSTLGTMTPVKSPSVDSVPMQVVDPPAMSSPPRSPTLTIRGGQSPSVARSPTMFSVTAMSYSSTATARRLIIRVPPSTGHARKPIKSPVSPSTEEELQTIVHVASQDSSDVGSPAMSSEASTSSPSSGSSSSKTP